MALSAAANAELDAFAAEAQASAALAAAPWRAARLNVDRVAAKVGDVIALNWEVPLGPIPVFLRVGAAGAWTAVAHNGNHEVTLGLDDVAVALRVGPQLVREVMLRAIVPASALVLYPAANLNVVVGGGVQVEWYATYCRDTSVRLDSGAWRPAPSMGTLTLASVHRPRLVEVTTTGFDGRTHAGKVAINVPPMVGVGMQAMAERLNRGWHQDHQSWQNT